MTDEITLFGDSERKEYHRTLSQEIRITNSNHLRRVYAQELYSYGFENLQTLKNLLRGVARIIQRSYEGETNPKTIKFMKKYARSLFRSIQEQQEKVNDLGDFIDREIYELSSD